MRNTVGQEKEISQGNLNGLAYNSALREYCDKHYNQLLPILAEKMHQEKVQQKKLKEVKASLNFEEVSQHSESGTPSRRGDLKKRIGSRCIHSMFGSPDPRRGRSKSPRKRDLKIKTMFKRLEKGVFYRLGDNEKTISAYSSDSRRQSYHSRRKYYQKAKVVQEDTRSHDQKIKGQALRTIYPIHSEDPEDHLKIFQATAKVKRWAMPTGCHMFNSTLTGSARKKCIKDHVEIHHIKQRKGEYTEDFVHRFKVESRDVKGAPEIMRILGFMHRITNPKLIKRLYDKIPKLVDEMMRITTSFLRGEV
ncbi:hypothetical protein Tco_1511337, partial [Tanacetum coccineum]